MTKQKKDIFKIANQKLKKNKIIQAIILSSLIANNTPLIAENINSNQPETIEDTMSPELNITCTEEYIEEANKLKSMLDELQLQNKYSEYIISELAKNNTQIKIVKTNGSNLYYDNTIYINGEKIKSAKSTYEKQSIKESVMHESIHMLQNKLNIMDDISKLPPKEAICLYLFSELDATVKAYVACDKYYETDTEERVNSSLTAISNIVSYAMKTYIEKAIYLNTEKEYTINASTTKNILEKFNSMGNLPKLNLDNIVDDIYKKIPDDYKERIQTLNNEYFEKGITLQNQKDIALK